MEFFQVRNKFGVYILYNIYNIANFNFMEFTSSLPLTALFRGPIHMAP